MRNCTAVSSILPMQDEASEQLPCFHGNSISAHPSVWYRKATKLSLFSKAKESSLNWAEGGVRGIGNVILIGLTNKQIAIIYQVVHLTNCKEIFNCHVGKWKPKKNLLKKKRGKWQLNFLVPLPTPNPLREDLWRISGPWVQNGNRHQ